MFKETLEGQTQYCNHETNNTSGICDKCLGKIDWKDKFHERFIICTTCDGEKEVQVCMAKDEDGNCGFVREKDLFQFIESLLKEQKEEFAELLKDIANKNTIDFLIEGKRGKFIAMVNLTNLLSSLSK